MKIVNIKKEKNNIYIVDLRPNFLERLFGIKSKSLKFKRSCHEFYTSGGGSIYYDKDGDRLRNNHRFQKAIDTFINKFND